MSRQHVVAAAAAVLSCVVACTPASPAPEPTPTGPVAGVDPTREACLVPLPESWQAAFAEGMLPREPGEFSVVRLIAPDGSLFVEYTRQGAHHELRWLPATGGPPVVVQRFGSSESDAHVFGASFDGRYLAYSLSWSYQPFDGDWSLYVWDSEQGGEPVHLFSDNRGRSQLSLVVHDGTVAWLQLTVAADGMSHHLLHLYRVAERRHETVDIGYSSWPARFGSLLLFEVSPGPDASPPLRAVSLETGRPAEVPPALAQAAGGRYRAASDDTVVWIDSTLAELWVWRTGWEEPWRAISSWEHDYLEWVNVAGDIVTWHSPGAQFALDLRSGSYTRITPDDGSTLAGEPYLGVLFDAVPGNVRRPPSDQTVVDTRTLPPLPACPGDGGEEAGDRTG